MAVEFQNGRCPVRAATFVTYGAEREPALPARERLHPRLLAQALAPGALLRAEVRRATLSTQRLQIPAQP